MLRITLKAAGLTDREVQELLPYIAGTADDFYDTPMYEKLYEYFAFTTGEMPYGATKARDADPDTWILEHLATLPTEQELQWLEA
jgi:hypothetical protein